MSALQAYDPSDLIGTSEPLEDLDEQAGIEAGTFVLKKLRPKHLDVASLFAQGISNKEIALIVGYRKEYIPVLLRQPLIVAEVRKRSEVHALRLEAMFGKAVDAVGAALQEGNTAEKLKAVRIHGELTKRIGGRGDFQSPSSESSEDRLGRLAERLVGLLEKQQTVAIDNQEKRNEAINGTCREVPGPASLRAGGLRGEADEEHGDGSRAEGI